MRRDLTRFANLPHTQHGSIQEFLVALVADGVNTIDYNGSPLDLLVKRTPDANTTLVVFHSALSPRMQALPVFSGLGVTSGLDLNVVCVADPSLELDDELNIGWFAGNDRQPLQEDLPSVLRHVIDALGADHLAFFGASAGGFAAMHYASHFPGSLAIPVNPQTILENYSDQPVLDYGRSAFGAADLVEAKAVLAERVAADLRVTYAGRGDVSIAYVQNLRDSMHLWRHLSHFMAAVADTADLMILPGDWGMGHVPPPKEVNRAILSAVAEAQGDWDLPLRRAGFRRHLSFADLEAEREALPPLESDTAAESAPSAATPAPAPESNTVPSTTPSAPFRAHVASIAEKVKVSAVVDKVNLPAVTATAGAAAELAGALAGKAKTVTGQAAQKIRDALPGRQVP